MTIDDIDCNDKNGIIELGVGRIAVSEYSGIAVATLSNKKVTRCSHSFNYLDVLHSLIMLRDGSVLGGTITEYFYIYDATINQVFSEKKKCMTVISPALSL